jgi:hypothetical protein
MLLTDRNFLLRTVVDIPVDIDWHKSCLADDEELLYLDRFALL